MKRILTTIQKRANKILLLAVLAGAMASCDSVLDYNEGDCSIKYLVKFKYDYNMEKVDAFAQEVRTVTLYAFDENGNMVYYKTDQGEMLADGNYSMYPFSSYIVYLRFSFFNALVTGWSGC